MDITIRHTEPMRLAALEHRGPFHTISESWPKFHEIGMAQKLYRPGAMMVSVFRSDPTTPPEDLLSGASMTVQPDQQIAAPLVEWILPAGRYATWVYKGPYEGLVVAWDQFVKAADAAGHAFAGGDCFEIYLNDPGETPAEELLTELYTPVV